MQIDHSEPEAGDPLQQPAEAPPIRQLGAEHRGTATHSDFTVIEFRTQSAARLAGERNFVYLWSHYGHPLAISRSFTVRPLDQSAWPPDLRHHPRAGDPGPSAARAGGRRRVHPLPGDGFSRPVRKRGGMPGQPEGSPWHQTAPSWTSTKPATRADPGSRLSGSWSHGESLSRCG